uniref:tetratricopeptide repeat protein n=1 Tax=Allorhizocola rhizosphaerae TaxID=1872709 RepID=UPI0013C3722F
MVSDPLGGRVTVVLGAAGFGKTTAVRAWLGDRQANWFRGSDLSGLGFATDDRFTVIDDMHLASGPPALATPPRARLVLIARRPLTAAVLRWAASPPAEVGPASLALPPTRIERMLRRRRPHADAAALAGRLHELTCGWPALVRLLIDDDLASPGAPGTPIAEYLNAEVLGDLTEAARRLFADTAHLGSVSADLATGLGHRRPEAVIGELARLGLLHPATPGHVWYQPVPVAATVARNVLKRRRVLATAAAWHLRHDRPADALRLHLAAGDHAACVSLLNGQGPLMLAGGAAADVVSAIRRLPPEHCDEQTDLLLAEALQMTGDSAGATAVYEKLAAGRDRLPAALAWRFGVAVYLWGNPRDAIGVFGRGVLGDETTADEATLLAWMAAAHRLAGDLDKCQDHAMRAHRAATASGSARAAVSAHVALALCADLAGDPAALQAHYAQALALAEPAGDVVQAIRIRANLAVALEREARYTDALEMVRPAVALAERAGHGSLLAMARNNEATLLHRLGRLDEAAGMYRQSIEAYQRINSLKVAYPLGGLGDLLRERGRHSEARAAYEESLKASTAHGNRQGMVPALCGLARTVAADDPELAESLAERALSHASGPVMTVALLAGGYAALGRGDAAEARRLALAAADSAGQHRDRAG